MWGGSAQRNGTKAPSNLERIYDSKMLSWDAIDVLSEVCVVLFYVGKSGHSGLVLDFCPPFWEICGDVPRSGTETVWGESEMQLGDDGWECDWWGSAERVVMLGRGCWLEPVRGNCEGEGVRTWQFTWLQGSMHLLMTGEMGQKMNELDMFVQNLRSGWFNLKCLFVNFGLLCILHLYSFLFIEWILF